MKLIKVELERISKSDTPYSTTRIFRDEAKYLLEKINKPDLSIDKCIDYLKVNSSNLNREQVILFQSINVNCSCTVCPECKEPDTAGFFCSKCIPL